MALTLEWRHRIDQWRQELARQFYRPLGALSVSGFMTQDHLSLADALTRDFSPMPAGTRWGAKWDYGWFKGEILVPDEAHGNALVLRMDLGGESLVFLDGQFAGAVDHQHKEIALPREAQPGARISVIAEVYAGHGPRVVHAGPIPPGRETVPEPPLTQVQVGDSTFGIWQEEVYQLWLDVETLYEIREHIDPDSLRVAEIDRGLRDFTLLVDFELPQAEMLAGVRAARERLQPLLACVNGSTTPTMVAFGHAHIDTAWLWPLAETERKCARTFSTTLALMDQYPEYRFLQSQPHLYQMVKDRYPALYGRIKQAIARGQWIPEGGAWVEPDTNVPSGESLIRQFVHGKRFFREEFGVESELLWLPDVFGYTAALPQIMRGCGIRYFSTQKLLWIYYDGDPFPYNTFTWEGIDGSEVYAHIHNDYNARTNPAVTIKRWRERRQKDGISSRMFPFGYGDGGGGPTRDHLEFVRRQADLEGAPKVVMGSPADFFRGQQAAGWPDARYVGELYLQGHRGTLTSQARTKRTNRQCEFALREAEMWSVAAAQNGFVVPGDRLDAAWKTVLLNQFHDILPGSSIQRVYEDAEAMYADALQAAQMTIQDATAALVDSSEAQTLFNSLSWPRTDLVALPAGFAGASAADGQPLPVQQTGDTIWTEVQAPPCGWLTLEPALPARVENTLRATRDTLENDLLRVRFDEQGAISSIYDKEAAREWSAGRCNDLRMYKDVPSKWDAWDIDSMYPLTPVALVEPAEIEVLADGPLFARLRVTRTLNNSTMVQQIILRRNCRRIDFHTVVDWQESHKMLKVHFPVTVRAEDALHEIQFGHVRRPTHRNRQYDADRFEVTNHKWTALVEEARGCAVLNDCKYGVSVDGHSINLTLLKSALAPDMTADKGRQEFTYAFYAWQGSLMASGLVQAGYELNVPLQTAAGGAGQASLFALDASNIIVDTVKPAEDGSGDVIVRLYESMRTATRCRLTTALPVGRAALTDMLENELDELVLEQGASLTLEFRPFEVKTIRLA